MRLPREARDQDGVVWLKHSFVARRIGEDAQVSRHCTVGARPSFEQERRSHVPTKAARPKGEGQDGPSLPRPNPATPRVARRYEAKPRPSPPGQASPERASSATADASTTLAKRNRLARFGIGFGMGPSTSAERVLEAIVTSSSSHFCAFVASVLSARIRASFPKGGRPAAWRSWSKRCAKTS